MLLACFVVQAAGVAPCSPACSTSPTTCCTTTARPAAVRLRRRPGAAGHAALAPGRRPGRQAARLRGRLDHVHRRRRSRWCCAPLLPPCAVYGIVALIGCGYAGQQVFGLAMLPDCIAYDTARTGRGRPASSPACGPPARPSAWRSGRTSSAWCSAVRIRPDHGRHGGPPDRRWRRRGAARVHPGAGLDRGSALVLLRGYDLGHTRGQGALAWELIGAGRPSAPRHWRGRHVRPVRAALRRCTRRPDFNAVGAAAGRCWSRRARAAGRWRTRRSPTWPRLSGGAGAGRRAGATTTGALVEAGGQPGPLTRDRAGPARLGARRHARLHRHLAGIRRRPAAAEPVTRSASPTRPG